MNIVDLIGKSYGAQYSNDRDCYSYFYQCEP